GNVVYSATVVSLINEVFIPIVSCQKNDRRIFGARSFTNEFRCIQTTQNRHMHVEKDQRKILIAQSFEGFRTRASSDYRIVRPFENCRNCNKVLSSVIDNKYGCFGGHP